MRSEKEKAAVQNTHIGQKGKEREKLKEKKRY